MGRRPRIVMVVATCLVVGAGCGDSDEAQQVFVPVEPGVLTVATTLPAPGMWVDAEGRPSDDPADIAGGYEWSIAEALADRFELRLEVVDVAFSDIVRGELGGADLALAQISITDERDDVLDFSVPYTFTDAGVVNRDDDEVLDLKTARERTWAVVGSTTDADLVSDDIRPDDPPIFVDDETAAVEAVAGRTVDVALMDLSTALILVAGRDDLEVGSQIATDEPVAAAMPQGASDGSNARVLDAALRALDADGSLRDFAETWLRPVYGVDPDDIPVIRIR